jgi:hypothetical protein
MPRKKKLVKIRPQITEQKAPSDDPYWHKEVEELMKLGYSFPIAYSLVSKRKIQELFEKDVRVTNGR